MKINLLIFNRCSVDCRVCCMVL